MAQTPRERASALRREYEDKLRQLLEQITIYPPTPDDKEYQRLKQNLDTDFREFLHSLELMIGYLAVPYTTPPGR